MATVGIGGYNDGQTVDLIHLLTHDVVVANTSNNLLNVVDEFLNTTSVLGQKINGNVATPIAVPITLPVTPAISE